MPHLVRSITRGTAAVPTKTMPEPAATMLLITGLAGVGAAVRKKRKAGNTAA